ncbi:PKD domain-containing protein [Echinicola jeungdonensis]|uniref:PKD domain-containing protein n=1 Tax=Echinicola jeungdonensis TaxID=709343 RepID=A0ABV5J6T4_9BACT|nr:PKD domain-containing protein [Echinicola jeungdonensis]MDN3670814.1 PKD domain-containing protein [Echinicola jeungdonensis]
MANKLTSITTQYRTYKVDQVLTHTQLNESIAFFEDQDRLTRVFLQGVGLVCGFKANIVGPKGKIRITQGVGVTTDGDLVKLYQNIKGKDEKNMDIPFIDYTHFRVFEDDKGKYTSHFTHEGIPLKLWEIIPESRVTESDTVLEELDDLRNKVVLLYLENFPKEAELCSGIDCDNQGIEQVVRLRVLLTTQEDAKKIINKDSVYQKLETSQVYKNLKKVPLKRVLLNGSNTKKLQSLEDRYYKAIHEPNTRDILYKGLKDILTFLNVSNFDFDLKPHLAKLFIPKPKHFLHPFQYDYDWLKDLINTYHEILDTFFEFDTACMPDIKAFPKHLMLGILEDSSQFPAYRHDFYPSPITGNPDTTKKIHQLIERLVLILKSYGIYESEIKITPSNLQGKLGSKAIPYYYKPSSQLVNHWNYQLKIRNQQDGVYRYFRETDPINNQTKTPLEFDLDEVDFFRVEGHFGHQYENALINLKDQVKKYNLDFDVKALAINEVDQELDLDKYKCHFEDLMVLLDAWNDEISCITGKISAFFSSIDLRDPKAASGEMTDSEGETAKGEEAEAVEVVKAKEKALISTFEKESQTVEEKEWEKVAMLIRMGKITIAEAQKLYPHLFDSTKDYKTKNREDIQESISHNISDSTGSLGKVFESTIKEEGAKYYSFNDIKVEAEKAAQEYVKEFGLEASYQQAFVNQPIEIIAASYDLSNYIPERLIDLNEQILAEYDKSIEKLCKKLKEFSKKIETLDLDDRQIAYYQSQALFFSSICCASKKLKILKAEIETRKEKILMELQLSNFIEHHPGLEHQAGVPRGGTFILVYFNKARKKFTKAEEFQEAIKGQLEGSGEAKAIIKAEAISREEALHMEKVTEFGREEFEKDLPKGFLNLLRTKGLLKSTLPDKTVVADFMLPYRCCSDCNPVNFVVPRPVVFLGLKLDTYCLGLTEGPIPFEVIPTDGNVKPTQEVPGLLISGHSMSIDPSVFPEELLGEEISFMVNDEPTNAKLTVYQSPVFSINPSGGTLTNPEITFSATPNFENAEYLWDFGDGTHSTEKTVTKTYELPINEENKVTVSLTITPENGACPKTQTQEFIFEEAAEEVSLDLEPKVICRDLQPDPILFQVKPEDGIVKGEGVQSTTDGFVFNPLLVSDINLGKALTFTVNGKSTDLVVRVFEKPKLEFEGKHSGSTGETVTVSFTVTTPFPAGTIYHWTINGKELEPIEKTNFTQSFPRDIGEVKAQVAVNLDNVCEETRSEIKSIPIIIIESDTGNCIEEGSNFIQALSRKYQTLTQSTDFEKIDDLGREIISPAVDVIFKIGEEDQNFLNGNHNDNLAEMLIPHITSFTKYIIEMNQSEELGIVVMKEILGDFVKLSYQLVKCQERSILNESQELVNRIFDNITQSMKRLLEQQIKWDTEKSTQSFLVDIVPAIEDVDFVLEAIKIHLDLLENS